MSESADLIASLVKVMPDFRDRLVAEVDFWLLSDGEISAYMVLSVLIRFVVERLDAGNVEGVAELFALVEQLLAEPGPVADAIATGFLEGLQSQQRLASKYWLPFLGERARAHCKAMDDFHGSKTPGL
jgi:hypothetical protein